MSHLPTATAPSPTPVDQRPTLDQVLDLPMPELLTLTGARLDTIDVRAEKYAGLDVDTFVGYIVVRASGTLIFTPADASDRQRDLYVRYLTAKRYGHPVPDLDAVLEMHEFTARYNEAVHA
ncbi:hypothetical protein ACN2WE_21305 [Streptomyces sp. cg28]|uniref:hypothetical protein n=1 Tax=Streptomyces sp. cg28 TaxID=3403457 RepID=UPI003B223317